MRYLDWEGLSYAPSRAYSNSLAIDFDCLLPSPHPTFVVGDTILTGPMGAPYFSYLPGWVVIEVYPDEGFKLPRVDPLTYALKTLGAPLSYRSKPPGPKAKYYPLYLEALEWASKQQGAYSTITIGDSPAPYELVTDSTRAQEVINSLYTKLYALDYETYGADIIEGVALADSKDSWYLHGQALAALPELRNLLCTQPGIAHSAIYEYKTTALNSLNTLLPTQMALLHDTRVMNYLLTNKPGSNRLKPLVKERLGRHALSFTDIAPKGDIRDTPPELQARYSAAGDARNTYDLFLLLKQDLQQANLWELYDTIERPLTPVLAEMEMAEIPIDMAVVEQLTIQYANRRSRLLRALRILGFQGDVKPESISTWFYKDLGIPVLKKTPGNTRGSIDADTLALLAPEHPAVQVYMALQTVTSLLTKFLLPALYGTPGTPLKTLRFAISQTSTRTGRLASSAVIDQQGHRQGGFNTQQFPKEARKMIVPPPGMVIWSGDWAQQEPRITAAASGDPKLMEALTTGDIYLALAQGDRSLRQDMKVYFLAAVYGDYNPHRDQIFAQYPDMVKWRQRVIEEARETGAAYSLFGRRRLVPEVNYSDPQLRAQGERVVINSIIQMTGADLIKLAMPKVQKFLRTLGYGLWLSVHDELVGAWPPELEAQYGSEVDRLMVESTRVPLRVDRASSAQSWYEAKA